MGLFEDALEFLKTKDGNGNELTEAVLERVHKLNSEAKSLRGRVKTAEEVKTKFDSISEILESNEIDLDGDLQEQFDSILKKSKNADTSNTEVKKMSQQLKKLEKQISDTSIENERLTKVGNRAKIKDKLSSAFSEKILNSNIALDYRINNGDFVLTEDGEVAYKNGDDVITDKIMDTYIANNPTEVRNTQNPGSGSKPPKGGKPADPVSVEALDTMTPQQYAALSDDQRKEIQTKISTGSD